MARFEIGHPRLHGAGRQKGRPNNATRNAREAIARVIDGNIDRLQGWLDDIAEKHGALAALRCLLDLLEYHVPKLTRAELTVDKPADEKSDFDVRKLSHEDRQAFREVLERYKEITDRYRDVEGSTAPNAEGVGDCND